LADVTAPNQQYWAFRFLSWSPDGKWLVVPDASSSAATLGLFLLAIDTGERRQLTQPPWYDDLDSAFSPDMKHLIFRSLFRFERK